LLGSVFDSFLLNLKKKVDFSMLTPFCKQEVRFDGEVMAYAIAALFFAAWYSVSSREQLTR
jgi:hypothetical protein